MSLDSTFNKLKLLGPGACYDTCGPKDLGVMSSIPGVYEAKLAGGRTCKLFKVLQTNVCKNNCIYCVHRRDNDIPRSTVSPDAMAKAFIHIYRQHLVEGIFLSSGIAETSETSMTRLIETAKILRFKFGYLGYLHLKIMPGVSASLLEQAVELADRVSLNLEVPDEKYASAVSPEKNFHHDLLNTLHSLNLTRNKLKAVKSQAHSGSLWRRRRHGWRARFGRAPSLTTQFVVGAAEESDRELIRASAQLQKNFGIYRVFFSALRPVSGTPLEEKKPTPGWREHRLYQAEWLLREYEFNWDEIPVDANGRLAERVDPKQAWANTNPEFFPVNLQSADYLTLLRVPGIGPLTAKRLVRGEKVKLPNKARAYVRSERGGQMRFF